LTILRRENVARPLSRILALYCADTAPALRYSTLARPERRRTIFALAQLFALIAALLHVVIFVLESLIFTRPASYQRFGITSQQDAETIRPMAYNQGFYNLFLAIGIGIGIVLVHRDGDGRIAGLALVVFACASMCLAATVLITTGRRYLRAALTQGTAPLLALIFIALS